MFIQNNFNEQNRPGQVAAERQDIYDLTIGSSLAVVQKKKTPYRDCVRCTYTPFFAGVIFSSCK